MRPVFRTLIVATLAFTIGCSSWAVTDASTAPTVIASHRNIRVLKLDGTVLAIDRALLRNDSIIGVSDRLPIAVARSDVKQIAVRQSDDDKTVGMVLIGVIGGGVVLLTGVIVAIGLALGSA